MDGGAWWAAVHGVATICNMPAPSKEVFPSRASLVVQLVKNPPAMQETLVQFLGQEDSLEEGMTTHSSILAWVISWTEEPGRLSVHGVTKSWT